MPYLIPPALFAHNIVSNLSPSQLELGEIDPVTRKGSREYEWLIAQVLMGIGRGLRVNCYTDYVPSVNNNPYLRKKIGIALWFLATACQKEMLPMFNFLVVLKGDKKNVPRGSLFKYWCEQYDSSKGYVLYCQTQQELACEMLEAGLVSIVLPPNGLITNKNALKLAKQIKREYKQGGIGVENLQTEWRCLQNKLNVTAEMLLQDAEAVLGETREEWMD